MRWCFTIILASFLWQEAHSRAEEIAAKTSRQSLLLSKVRYLPFLEGSVDYERILNDSTIPWESPRRHVQPSRSAWLRMDVMVETVDGNDYALVLHGLMPREAEFLLFSPRGELVGSSKMGSGVPLSMWEHKDRLAYHVFNVREVGSYTFLVKLNTGPFPFIHPSIHRYETFLYDGRIADFKMATVIGGLLAVFLYNLMLWRSLKRRIFLNFALLNAIYIVATCDVYGILALVTAGTWVPLSNLTNILPFVCMGFFLDFCSTYLSLRRGKILHHIVVFSSRGLYLAAVMTPLNPTFSQFIAMPAMFLGSLGAFTAALKQSRSGHSEAKFLVAAMIPVGLSLALLNSQIEVSFGLSFKETLPWVLVFQIICIGSGLAGRITQVRRKLVATLAARAEDLEDIVRERTKRYEEANHQLLSEVHERGLAEQEALRQTRLLKEAQAKLISSSRLSAIGEMAAGISHEINNPLTIIQGYLHLLKSNASMDQSNQKLVEKIIGASDRIGQVIKSLREFNLQEQSSDPSDIQLAVSWDLCLDLTREQLRSAAIECRFEDISSVSQSLKVKVRPADLTQALIGMLKNSIDAIHQLDERWIEVKVLHDETYVTIRIVDSGRGLPSEVAEHVFTPFFTTKSPGAGMGMGLSVAKQLMSSAGGDLRYVTGEAHTTFEIMLLRSSPEDGRVVEDSKNSVVDAA